MPKKNISFKIGDETYSVKNSSRFHVEQKREYNKYQPTIRKFGIYSSVDYKTFGKIMPFMVQFIHPSGGNATARSLDESYIGKKSSYNYEMSKRQMRQVINDRYDPDISKLQGYLEMTDDPEVRSKVKKAIATVETARSNIIEDYDLENNFKKKSLGFFKSLVDTPLKQIMTVSMLTKLGTQYANSYGEVTGDYIGENKIHNNINVVKSAVMLKINPVIAFAGMTINQITATIADRSKTMERNNRGLSNAMRSGGTAYNASRS